jgi:hypothetical protein
MPGMDALAAVKWSSKLLEVYRSKLVFADMCNRNFEGEVTSGGSVKIFMPGDVDVAAYTRDTTTIAYQRVVPGEQVMKITKREYFALKTDDLEKMWAFAGGALWARHLERGSYKLAKSVDTYISGTVMANAVPTAHQLATRVLGTGANARAYDLAVDLATKLEDADVPLDDVTLAVPPAFHALLSKDDRYTSFNTPEAVANLKGKAVGMIDNLKIATSTNIPVSGSSYTIIVAHKDAVTFADMLGELETVPRDKDDFEERVRSQLVYDAHVVQPQGLASCVVQFAA